VHSLDVFDYPGAAYVSTPSTSEGGSLPVIVEEAAALAHAQLLGRSLRLHVQRDGVNLVGK